MADAPKLAKKITRTTIREYDRAGSLVSETVTVETSRFTPEPKPVVGFSRPVEIAV